MISPLQTCITISLVPSPLSFHSPPPPPPLMHTPSSHTCTQPTVVTGHPPASRVRSLVPLTPWHRPSVSMTTSTRSCISLKKTTDHKRNKYFIPSTPTQDNLFSPYHLIIINIIIMDKLIQLNHIIVLQICPQ